MQKKPIIINIPEPCHQPWTEMAPREDGRFCEHCQTKVVDYSGWSDEALIKLLASQTGRACGRFHVSQLDRPLTIPFQPKSKLYRIAIALGLTLLLAQSAETKARTRPPLVNGDWPKTNDEDATVPNVATIKGSVTQVIDGQSNTPIAYGIYNQPDGHFVSEKAIVTLKQNGKLIDSVLTDTAGKFEFSMLTEGDYVLSVIKAPFVSLTQNVVLKGGIDTNLSLRLQMPYMDPIIYSQGMYLNPPQEYDLKDQLFTGTSVTIYTVHKKKHKHRKKK
jgi:hypothetical protein